MKPQVKIFGILFALFIGVLVNSCGEEPSRDYGDFIDVFATYKGMEDGMHILEYQAHDDSPAIILRTADIGLDDLSAGDRIYMRYTVLDGRSERDLEVRCDGAMHVVYDLVRQAGADTMAMIGSTPIRVTSLWRTGNYINLNSWVPYVGNSFQMMLIADKATIGNDTVKARLIYSIGSQEPAFERKCYASFNIEHLWTRKDMKSLRIYVDDPKGDDYYEFNKN